MSKGQGVLHKLGFCWCGTAHVRVSDIPARRPVVIEHRYGVESSTGRGWRVECDCGWLSPTYLTLEMTYQVGDRHVDQDMG